MAVAGCLAPIFRYKPGLMKVQITLPSGLNGLKVALQPDAIEG